MIFFQTNVSYLHGSHEYISIFLLFPSNCSEPCGFYMLSVFM